MLNNSIKTKKSIYLQKKTNLVSYQIILFMTSNHSRSYTNIYLNDEKPATMKRVQSAIQWFSTLMKKQTNIYVSQSVS